MGAAMFMDLYLLQHLYHRPVTHHVAATVEFGSKLVALGLAGAWCSGMGFLAFYYLHAPFALTNPKLWAKLAVVSLLTVNGFLLHGLVLPRLRGSHGRPLLAGMRLRHAFLPLAAGVVSAASWMFAFTLGIVRELNFVVSGALLLKAYAVLISVGLVFVSAVHIALSPHLPVRAGR